MTPLDKGKETEVKEVRGKQWKTIVMADGAKYEGQVVDDKYHGNGKYTF